MADDLVKRLRTCASDQGGWMYEEAADRIEQLEAALKKIAHVNNTISPFNSYVDKEIWLALQEQRAALEGKDG